MFSSTDSSGLLAENGNFDYIHDFSVKHIKILLNSTDDDAQTSLEFEGNFANIDNPKYKVLEVNYAMTFDNILNEYELKESYYEGQYVYNGIYYNGIKISDMAMPEFLEAIPYNDGEEIYLTVKYVCQTA